MKQQELNLIFRFLGRLQLNKIRDKEVRSGLAKIYLEMYKKALEFDKDLEELRKKYFEGKEAEINAYTNTVNKLNAESDTEKRAEIEKEFNPDTVTLVKEFDEIVSGLLTKEIELEFEKIDKDKFVEALIDLDIEFTFADLIVLKDLYKE